MKTVGLENERMVVCSYIMVQRRQDNSKLATASVFEQFVVGVGELEPFQSKEATGQSYDIERVWQLPTKLFRVKEQIYM